MPYDDDDDWVGTPPEGRISRDRANPGFWATQKPVVALGATVVVVLLIVVLVLAVF